jgi:hypothetical protein
MKLWSASSVLFALLFVLISAGTTRAADGELRPFKRGSWQQIRKAHEGRPVVVHFWA